jgi:uncharacterized protein (DUF488 family)
MSQSVQFLTIGYGRWPTKVRIAKLLHALKAVGVELLIDTRHSVCASQTDASSDYGPRNWHVIAGNQGIARLLAAAGIQYLWVVELGNPQKSDDSMTVLREHLADPEGRWPIHRGLRLVADLLGEGRRCCLMCACEKSSACHRRIIAETLLKMLPAGSGWRDLSD